MLAAGQAAHAWQAYGPADLLLQCDPRYGAPSGGPGAAATAAGNILVTEVHMVVAAERVAAFLEWNAHTNGTGLQMEDALKDIILDAWLLPAGGNTSEASEGLSDSEFAGELAACFAAAVHAGMPPPPPPPPGGEAGRLAPADAHGLAHPPPIPDRHSPPGPHPSAERNDGAERARGLHQGRPLATTQPDLLELGKLRQGSYGAPSLAPHAAKQQAEGQQYNASLAFILGSDPQRKRIHPVDVAIGPSGQIAMTDRSSNTINIFHPNGTFDFEFGSLEDDDGDYLEFGYHNDIAIGPSGQIAVADGVSNTVQLFHPNGTLDLEFGSRGGGDGDFRQFRGIAIGPSGQIAVAVGSQK